MVDVSFSTAGTKIVNIIVDPDNVIVESDEGNNSLPLYIMVSGSVGFNSANSTASILSSVNAQIKKISRQIQNLRK